jgi:hypothetical protein
MTPPRLPGLPTFSALMLSALITVLLGLAGPIDLSRVKEWQTLSAAVIALIAAGIAYLAAMAKVNFDRSVHEGKQRRRNQNVLIRLRYAALIFRAKMSSTRKRLAPSFGTSGAILARDISIMASDISIEWPPEFQEAWENLDLFGFRAADIVANIKYNRGLLDAAVARLDQTKEYQYKYFDVPKEIGAVIKLMQEIDTFIEDLLASLP